MNYLINGYGIGTLVMVSLNYTTVSLKYYYVNFSNNVQYSYLKTSKYHDHFLYKRVNILLVTYRFDKMRMIMVCCIIICMFIYIHFDTYISRQFFAIHQLNVNNW